MTTPEESLWWEGRDCEVLGPANLSGRPTVLRGTVAFVDNQIAWVRQWLSPPGVYHSVAVHLKDLLVPLEIPTC
jgi:hypothetical protein